MHVDTEHVPETVHVKLLVLLLLDQLFRFALQQSQFDHTFRQHFNRMLFQLIVCYARSHHLHTRHLRLQHEVVDLALRLCVTTIDRESACDIGSVALVFSSRIDQQQVAVAKLAVVVDVVKHSRVWTSSHDRGVSRSGGAMPPEYLLDQRFHLKLLHPRLHGLHRFAMSFGSDVGSSLHDLDLFRSLHNAQLVHNRRRINDCLWRVNRLAIQ